jgi:hypothetical protein
MGRRLATLWHAMFSVVAGVLYFYFVLPRWPELMGETSHALGTVLRIVTGALIALAALPVVFTWRRSRKPEYGTPQLALTLRICSIVVHVLAGVLIGGAAAGEIWLSSDTAGQWLFGIYGATAAIALLGFAGFYLSLIADCPPPPPKPLKTAKKKKAEKGKPLRLRRKRGEKDTARAEDESAEADTAKEVAAETQTLGTKEPGEADDSAETLGTKEPGEADDSAADELPTSEAVTPEDTATAETTSRGGLRNRRPTGKSPEAGRRRRSRRGIAVKD